MAEGESLGFLAHKVGPLPVWLWGALIAGGYYVAKDKLGLIGGTGTAGAATTTVNESDLLDSEPKYGGSGYSSNAMWEDAAINYLVGESVPPDEASAAVWNYLHSKVLTSQEQKDVNLAIEGIGPPPSIPAPAKVTRPKPRRPGKRKPPPVHKPEPVNHYRHRKHNPRRRKNPNGGINYPQGGNHV